MNSIEKLLKVLPKKIKLKLYFFIVLLIIATLFELLSISALIPIAEIIINGKTSFQFINNYIQYSENNLIKDQILLAALVFIIFLFLLKTLYLISFSYWTNKFSQNIYKFLSEKILEKYLNNKFLFFVNQKSSDLIRNIVFEAKNLSQMTLLFKNIS